MSATLKIKNITLYLNSDPQTAPSGRPFRLSGIRKVCEKPPKWIDGGYKYNWQYTFRYLDVKKEFFSFEVDHEDKFVCKLQTNQKKMSVKIKDRKTEVEYLRMACNLAELGIQYQHADLILRSQERLKKLKGKFSLSYSVEIHHKWKEDWREYFEALEKEKEATK